MMQQITLYLTTLLMPLLLLPIPVQCMLAALVGLFFALRNRQSDHKQVSAFFGTFRFGGHRGSPMRAPENTLASFARAAAEGADLVEFDIGLTRDGRAVLMHDHTLDRTTNLRGELRDRTLSELRNEHCDCAANFKAQPQQSSSEAVCGTPQGMTANGMQPEYGTSNGTPTEVEPEYGMSEGTSTEIKPENSMPEGTLAEGKPEYGNGTPPEYDTDAAEQLPTEDKFGNPLTEPAFNGIMQYNDADACSSKTPTAPICTMEDMVRWAKGRGMKMIFDVKDTDKALVDQLHTLFEQYELYDCACVCSFFPSVVYRVKRHNARIITGLTWRRWFVAYTDLAWTVPRQAHPLAHRAAIVLDVLWMWCVKLGVLPHFLGADMVLTERGEISDNFVKYMHARGLQVCAWTVNDEHEMAWMAHKLRIPFLTDLPYKAQNLVVKKQNESTTESAFELN